MKLTVIGCSGGFPTATSPASCYLVEHDGHRLVLDLGNGALSGLQRHVDPLVEGAITAVVLSHCHLDHCADVGTLYVMRHYGPQPPLRPLPLFGPGVTVARLAAIYGMADPQALLRSFDVRPFEGRPTTIGPFTIETSPAVHPVEAYSVRVTAGGRSLTYSGDTGPTPSLVDLARGTDIALFEATFVGDGNPAGVHMSGADAGRAAAAAGAGLLVLTHGMLWNDEGTVVAEARAEYDGPIEVARPDLTVSV